jgi:hypothetical protein
MVLPFFISDLCISRYSLTTTLHVYSLFDPPKKCVLVFSFENGTYTLHIYAFYEGCTPHVLYTHFLGTSPNLGTILGTSLKLY